VTKVHVLVAHHVDVFDAIRRRAAPSIIRSRVTPHSEVPAHRLVSPECWKQTQQQVRIQRK
jgi:hypothetical protein